MASVERVGDFGAVVVAGAGAVIIGVLDAEGDDWLARTAPLSVADARTVAARLQRAIHDAEAMGG